MFKHPVELKKGRVRFDLIDSFENLLYQLKRRRVTFNLIDTFENLLHSKSRLDKLSKCH